VTDQPVTDKPEKLNLKSMDLAAEKQAELLRLFPEIHTEGGKIDFDRLKLALGETVDVGRERYGLTWPGKADCFKTIQAPSLGTLRPARDESVNFDTTENLIIEGDNLEVLKLLQKSYLGKVKMIYIDPPYNTGNDFIYPDQFGESLNTYLDYTGQSDNEGRKFGTNVESDGRFHSKWLNMMYPRLYLAKNLLSTAGAIFINIDDGELLGLKALCNEVFGEENLIAHVIWQKKYTRSNDAKFFSDNHDHVLMYAQSIDHFKLNLQPRNEDQVAAYTNPDNHPKGPWKATPLHAKSGSSEGFTYKFRNGVTWGPPIGTFPRFSEDTMKLLDETNSIWFGADGNAMPSKKTFLSEAKDGVTPVTIWEYEEVGHNHEANNELKALGLGGIFNNPKPTKLLRRMLELTTLPNDDHIVLDFFAGSGTTAHAVFDMNKNDGGNRRAILVQLPEPTDRMDYSTIAEITKERVRRVIAKINNESDKELDLRGTAKQDRGFRVFKLDQSNFMGWDAGASTNAEALGKQLDLSIDHVRQGRSDDDLFYELLLKSGFPLTTPVEKLSLAGKAVYSIGGGVFLICLEREITTEAIKAMADMKPSRVVCLDDGFRGNDQLKSNAVLTFKAKGVAKFQTV
jgi:adenine-specific DNA-methyltransferase